MKNYRITVNGKTYEVAVEEIGAAATPAAAPAPAPAQPAAPAAAAPAKKESSAEGTAVTSPMQGTILEVKAAQGQSVKKGETIFVLEAMKMENEIPAPCDGQIVALNAAKGSSVQAGDTLAVIG